MDIDNGIELAPVSAQQHVPDIEHAIHVIKERYRALYHNLPYKSIPKIMVKAAAQYVVKWLNMFPPKGGVSSHYSPRAILTGRPLDYNLHCKYSFGSFVLALNETTPSNTPAPRTLDCIFLDAFDGPTHGYKLLHLSTNKIITRRKITEVPITQTVIDRVETLAKQDGMPTKLHFIMREKGMKFLNNNDALIAGVDDESDENNKNENYTNETNENDENYTNEIESYEE